MHSMVLTQILQKNMKIPWAIRYEIRSIVYMLGFMNFTISHMYREGNMATDWLANLGSNARKCLRFDGSRLPRHLQGIIKADKWGLSCIKNRG